MPKVLLYITAKIIWNFLFYNTDFHENRAHVQDVYKRQMSALTLPQMNRATVITNMISVVVMF